MRGNKPAQRLKLKGLRNKYYAKDAGLIQVSFHRRTPLNTDNYH
jgi:hypothetical protein